MAENDDAALEQLRAYGLVVDVIDLSGRIVRVPCEDQPRKKNGWYVAHELRTDEGRTFVVGAYGDWRRDDGGHSIQIASKGLTQAARDELRRRRDAQRRAAEAERRQVADDAAARARRIWAKLPPDGRSEYLSRKQVRAFGLRFSRGSVVVPMQDARGALVGLQFISGGGDKKFLTGTAKRGAWHQLGELGERGPIGIAEGYATAATVHQATDWPVLVAFDAGNLLPVAEALRRRCPGRLIVLCADDDHATPGNPGQARAQLAARKVGGLVATPHFRAREGRTDWNDLQREQGSATVSAQLRAALDAHEAARNAVASVVFDLDGLLRDFILVHGTSLCFDGRRGRLMSVAHLKVSAGEPLVKQWLAHPSRRLVDEEAIVFDPGGQDPRSPKINLYTGMECRPDGHASCSRLLAHLYLLCGERERLYDWVLKWIALPLQRPGTKMQTAIVMYGAEGTGKNVFWETVLGIYGRWGVLIGQEEIESQFNAWESAKLFAVADEVVPRNEMRALKGRLKKLVTGDRVMINEKNQPLREERNAMNIVFLSNEIVPLVVDPGDRRYCGVRCDAVQSEEYYSQLGAEIANGGVEALYHYLLHYDLEGFHAHAKPYETDERTDLIEANEAPALKFWRDWCDGQLPLPYVACRATDLYQAFRAWCLQTGERYVPNETQFGLALKQHEHRWFRKDRPRVAETYRRNDAEVKVERRPTCYVLLDLAAADQVRRLDGQLEDFRDAMTVYCAEQRKHKL
jgi:putative DNA primase/helicase